MTGPGDVAVDDVEPSRVVRRCDEDDRPRARWERAIGWAIVAICIVVVVCDHQPGHAALAALGPRTFGDLFRNTTTNGGDMGAHVWWPWFLERQLVPEVPALGLGARLVRRVPGRAVLLPAPGGDGLRSSTLPFMPYNVAFKLVTVSRPAAAARPAAYSFARGHAGAVAGAARVRDRGARHARADAQRLADLRRQHREHARRRVLVHDRARARACSRWARSRTRSTPASDRGCPRC